MYVAVIHKVNDAQAMLSRGERLSDPANAPAGVRGLEFFPATDLTAATCLWESDSVETLRDYIDGTLGDSCENSYFEISAEHAHGLPQQEPAQA
jgi:hypothetical protein